MDDHPISLIGHRGAKKLMMPPFATEKWLDHIVCVEGMKDQFHGLHNPHEIEDVELVRAE